MRLRFISFIQIDLKTPSISSSTCTLLQNGIGTELLEESSIPFQMGAHMNADTTDPEVRTTAIILFIVFN